MKNKHFRKDVVMARIIAAILLIVLIALIVVAVQFFTKSKDKNEDSQNSQDTQGSYIQSEEISDSEEETEEIPESESESETETEADIDMNEDLYVKTTTQVKLRQEPNTNCATLDRIDGGTKLKVIESLQEWYKVNHNGQIGYVNANYAEIVEE